VQLPEFEYLKPQNLEEVLDFLHEYKDDARIISGGTDLLVRMKKGLLAPKYLISLKNIKSLSKIEIEDEFITIGSGTSLNDIYKSDLVKKKIPALANSAQSVGAWSIQHFRGTIGGNICQNSRCLYYNQSEFWRSGKLPCHKTGGKTCYAKKNSSRCHATYQSDTAPALIALNAEATLKSKSGTRTVPLLDLYTSKGETPFAITSDEILTEFKISLSKSKTGNAYKRLSYRSAIDYPIVSAGVFVEIEENTIKDARIVVGAIGRAPLLIAGSATILKDKSVADEASIQKAADMALDRAKAFAVDNVGASLEYRIKMVSVLVKRSLKEAISMAE